MNFNRAYSAAHGYDLRAPYNVPMGEIRQLRVVRPFSIASYQENTIVEGFGHCNKPTYYNFPSQNGPRHSQYIQAAQGPYSGQICFNLVQNEAPWYSDVQLEKLYLKVYL